MAIGILLLSSEGEKLKGVIVAADTLGGLSLHVPAQAATLTTALHAMREFLPEITLIDALTPGIDPSLACRQVIALEQNTKIIVLAVSPDDRQLVKSLTSGASGILRAFPTAREMDDCVRTILRNRIYIGPLRTQRHPAHHAAGTDDEVSSTALAALSDREIEVLTLIADGAKTREIAESLRISEKTVETHRGHIMQKLNIRSIAGLTKFAVKHGLTTLNNH